LLEGCPIVASITPPRHLLIASAAFGPRLSASAVAAAIARGVQDGGLPEPDLLPLEPVDERAGDVRALLDGMDFDARMRRARAVVIAAARLEERTLAGSLTFEIATRARQSGVPAYAVTAENRLDAFDARILDLQVILEARGARSLEVAGRKLADVV
jgi:glycerate kinase